MKRVPKNPWMSMWLSAANRVAGAGRAAMTAAARRGANAALKAAAKPPRPPRPPRKRS